MGLAPQIVEEVFNIVKDLNHKEKVTFLLAEQNTNMALKYADYGYIMESGRVVMDGKAATWPATRTSRSSTWAWAAASARASRTSRATSAASAGWLDAPPERADGAFPLSGTNPAGGRAVRGCTGRGGLQGTPSPSGRGRGEGHPGLFTACESNRPLALAHQAQELSNQE
jgi:hypothetical protein